MTSAQDRNSYFPFLRNELSKSFVNISPVEKFSEKTPIYDKPIDILQLVGGKIYSR